MAAWQVVCEKYIPSSWVPGYCKQCGFHQGDHDLRPKSRG